MGWATRVSGEGSFKKVVEAIEEAKKHNIPVAALSTLSAMNFNVIDKMIKIVQDLDVHWLVGLIQTQVTGFHEQDMSRKRIKELLHKISKVKNLRTSKHYLDFILNDDPIDKCFAGIGYAIVSPEAVIYPCFPAQFDRSYDGVSILKNKTFGDAFQELPLYRKKCDTCELACHVEANNLYLFKLNSIRQSLSLTKPFHLRHKKGSHKNVTSQESEQIRM